MPLRANKLQSVLSGATDRGPALASSISNLPTPSASPQPVQRNDSNPWTSAGAYQRSIMRRGNTYAPSAARNGSQYHLAQARAPSIYGQDNFRASFPAIQENPSQQDPQGGANFYNPSAAPAPSAVTTAWHQRGSRRSNASVRSTRQPIKTDVCRLSNRSHNSYHLGDILSVPYHTANTNPNANFDDPHLKETVVGPVYPKRRMFVVLVKYQNHLECLPLYSHGGRGIKHKHVQERKEYVAVMNVGEEETFVNEGCHAAVAVRCRK